jgi:hypothetical protein
MGTDTHTRMTTTLPPEVAADPAAGSSVPTKLPHLQFYVGDHLKDPAVRMLSLAARGLWFEMLCIMHLAGRRGFLEHAEGRPLTVEQLARAVGEATKIVGKLIAELEAVNVFSRDAAGTIFSRRMVRDEHKRRLCAASGKLGGNPALTRGDNPTLKGPAKGQDNGEDNRNPTPSLSVSASVALSPSASAELGGTSSPQTPSDAAEQSPDRPAVTKRKGKRRTRRQPAGYGVAFAEFWAAYPWKAKRPPAERAWAKIAPDAAQVEQIMAGLERHKASHQWTKDGGQYIPLPATWLNARQWEDEIVVAAAPAPPLAGHVPADGTPAIGCSPDRAEEIMRFLRQAEEAEAPALPGHVPADGTPAIGCSPDEAEPPADDDYFYAEGESQ